MLIITCERITVLGAINYVLSRDVKQFWYADDASAGGKLQHIKDWWDGLVQLGPEYGYLSN